MKYLFELGRNTDLSRAEIEQVFLALQIQSKFEQEKSFLFVETTEAIDESKLMDRLGGTIKIATQVKSTNKKADIIQFLETEQTEGKMEFSLSGSDAKHLALEIKKQLKNTGRSVRYIEAKNTATILHNNLVEKNGDLTLTKHGLFVTRAIQAIEEWGERDFGRPGRDSKSGMLPPKLARIMLNLVGKNPTSTTTLLDPFCGSGTVLSEAALLGYHKLFGSDASEKAVDDSNKNIEWLKKNNDVSPTVSLEVCNATTLHTKLKPKSIDVIVSEPYMGLPLRGIESKQFVEKQASDLRILYLAAFESFAKVLKPKATVIFVIPRFLTEKQWVRIHCTEKIQNFGFEVERLSSDSSSLNYSRPDQFVAREIWKFRKT